MPLYRVTHTTRYRHDSAATAAWQSLHLQPRHEAAQHCDAFELEIAPHPGDLAARVDYFGNKQHIFTLREPHRELKITSRSLVRRDEPVLPMPGLTPLLSEIPALIATVIKAEDFTLAQFCHPSPLVPLLPAAKALVAGLTADLDPARTSVMDWLAVLGARFGEAFTFDREATRISTPLTEVMVTRRGVCQDFAHLLISCLRQHGLPAAYVSGYLLTRPPPGRPRLVGGGVRDCRAPAASHSGAANAAAAGCTAATRTRSPRGGAATACPAAGARRGARRRRAASGEREQRRARDEVETRAPGEEVLLHKRGFLLWQHPAASLSRRASRSRR